MERLTRIVGTETQDNVTVIWYGNCVLLRWQIVLSMQQTTSIQIECMLQIDLFHVGVGRSTDTDHIERVTVQMEWMTKIWLLDCVHENVQ